MSKHIVLLGPGHGRSWDNKWRRPLMALRKRKVTNLGKLWPSEFDSLEGYYREDMGTLDIANAAQEKLISMGHKVFLTRNDERNAAQYISELLNGNKWKKDNWASNKWIRHYAHSIGSDIFVSIHTNAGGGTGVSAFYTDGRGLDLAEAVANAVCKTTEWKLRNLERHTYEMLKDNSKGHACLVECGFHDHKADLAILIDPEQRKLIGESIAVGIGHYIANPYNL